MQLQSKPSYNLVVKEERTYADSVGRTSADSVGCVNDERMGKYHFMTASAIDKNMHEAQDTRCNGELCVQQKQSYFSQ